MGLYVNKGNWDFKEARNSDYIDKSGLIAFVNRTLSTNTKMTCVSRARRFGKSLALHEIYVQTSRHEGYCITRAEEQLKGRPNAVVTGMDAVAITKGIKSFL